MPVSDISIAERQSPHMGPVARGFAALGDMAERAVSTVAGIAADAAQAPSRLGHAAALLTGDGQLGSLWQVMAPFAGLLLGAASVALAIHRLLQPRRRALAAFRPTSVASFGLGLLHSLLLDVSPAVTYACLAAGSSFLFFFWGSRPHFLRHRNLPEGRQSNHQHVHRRLAAVCGHLVARIDRLAARGGRYRRAAPVLTSDIHRAIQSEPRSPASHLEAAAQSNELGGL